MSNSPTVNSGLYDNLSDAFNEDLSWSHQRRLQAYRDYWLYYLGKHWSYSRDEGEPQLTLNYSRRLVDVHTNFAFNKGFTNIIPDDPTTEKDEAAERDFIRKMLEETWRLNRKQLWCLTAGQMGGVTGDCFVRVSWDDTDPMEPSFARADILPSHFCFPDPGGQTGWDLQKVGRMLIMIPVHEEMKIANLAARGFSQMNKSSKTHQISFLMEEWTNPVLDPVTKEVITPAMYRLYKGRDIIEEKENPVGMIPVVHISNYPLAGEYYGISDLADLTELNREFNEKNTDVSDIINYHGSPITIVEGAKLRDLEKGVNRVWGIPEGASVKNLGLEGDLEASNSHIKNLKTTMLELTATPPQALGMVQTISNTSGVAMQLQYLPMLEKRNVKIQTYGQGIENVNRLIIRTTEIADRAFGAKMKKLEGDKYRNSVTWPDPLPQDERRNLEISKERMEMGISNRRRELEKEGLSQREIDQIMAQAKKEKTEDLQLEYESSGDGLFDTSPGSGNSQLQRGGANETRGEKISETLTDGNDPKNPKDEMEEDEDK